jgi:glycosyltransferase involved in cell wall biosynthesis
MQRAVTAALDAIAPDAVAITSYSTPDARAALAWCRRHRRGAVMMFDSRAADADRAGWRESVKRLIVRQFDAALVAGTPHAAYAANLGISDKAIFAPLDTVDNTFFDHPKSSTPTLPGLDSSQPFFLASNRFVARKNLRGLVAGYARYRAAGGRWRLVLLGDGPEREVVESVTRDAGVPDVTFAGFQQIDVLPSYYAAAGAFVHPAHADQWGLVVNEAMAAGLPVIVSTGAGCAQDLVREGENGFTFRPTDEEHLAAVLACVAAMPPATRAAFGAASQAIIARYRPEDFAREMDRAATAAVARSDHGLTLGGRLVLGALRVATRRSESFQSVPE